MGFPGGSSNSRKQFVPWSRAVFIGLMVSVCLLAVPRRISSAAEDVPQLLVPERPLERVIAVGESHTYRVHVREGEVLRAVVFQQWVDLGVRILAPGGRLTVSIDRPSGHHGPETISFISPFTGDCVLQVFTVEAAEPRGSYRLFLSEPRRANANDESRFKAERAIDEAETNRNGAGVEQLRLSIRRFAEARETWARLGDRYEEAVASYGMGLVHRQVGENQQAVADFDRSLALMRALGDAYGVAAAEMALGYSYLYLGEIETARSHFRQSLTGRRRIGDRTGEARALYGIAWTDALSGAYELAMQQFRTALTSYRALGLSPGLVLTGLGKVAHQMARHREALGYFSEALTLLREKGDPFQEADTIGNLGFVQLALGDEEEAKANFSRALEMRCAVGDRFGEAAALYGLAMAAEHCGDFGEAKRRIEEALQVADSVRSKGDSYRLRSSYFASIQHYYEFYIDLLMQQDRREPAAGHAAEALRVVERSRARSLLDLLTESHLDIRAGADPLLLTREREIQERLSIAGLRHQLLLNGKVSADKKRQIDLANAEVAELAIAYDQVLSKIRASNPRYATLTEPPSLTVPEIQRRFLNEETVLLEYALGEKRSYLWAVSQRAATAYELPGRGEIELLARRAYDLMTARNDRRSGESPAASEARVRRADWEFPSVAMALSRMLLGPAAASLGKNRLLVVADGALQYLPFAALAVPGEASYRPLIAEHEIVNLASITTLAQLRLLRESRPQPSKTLAVFADPVFTTDDERVPKVAKRVNAARLEGRKLGGVLPRLSYTRWEADQIALLVGAGEVSVARDFGANREAVLSGELGKYRIIHFATHAFMDDRHPELSGIALSMVGEKGNSREGFVRVPEFSSLKLSADLVVLGGCSTGLGREVRGEGLVGLVQALTYAGAERVLASSWAVNDKASAELMVKFYRHLLGEKMQPPAALRAAQMEIGAKAGWAAPYFWAPFGLHGRWM